MNAKWTPGPWLIGRGADGNPIVHTAPDEWSPSGQGIAHICKRAMSQDHAANARLIAEAPAMAEALRLVMRYHDATGENDVSAMLAYGEAIAAIRPILARLDGRE